MREDNVEKPKLQLVGLNGNALAILGRAYRAAREAGWEYEMIDTVLEEATSGDYNHLLQTMMKHFNVNGGEDE